MLFRVSVLGFILFLLLSVVAQEASHNRVLGPEFNLYDGDFIPEHHPDIDTLVSYMSVEDAISILQRELAGAQFIGLDGVMAEHWGNTSGGEDVTPQAAAVQTLKVDERGITWLSAAINEGEYNNRFYFDEAISLWTRFSMAEQETCGDDFKASPQGVALFLLSEAGVETVMQNALPLSKILPAYPDQLPTYFPNDNLRPLPEPGLFLEGGSPEGFVVCCFSSTGLGVNGEPNLHLDRLPLVLAALERLGSRLTEPQDDGLVITVPLAEPSPAELDVILARCNENDRHNQGTVLCQFQQLSGLVYMKAHFQTAERNMALQCAKDFPDDYTDQANCVLDTMMGIFTWED